MKDMIIVPIENPRLKEALVNNGLAAALLEEDVNGGISTIVYITLMLKVDEDKIRILNKATEKYLAASNGIREIANELAAIMEADPLMMANERFSNIIKIMKKMEGMKGGPKDVPPDSGPPAV